LRHTPSKKSKTTDKYHVFVKNHSFTGKLSRFGMKFNVVSRAKTLKKQSIKMYIHGHSTRFRGQSYVFLRTNLRPFADTFRG